MSVPTTSPDRPTWTTIKNDVASKVEPTSTNKSPKADSTSLVDQDTRTDMTGLASSNAPNAIPPPDVTMSDEMTDAIGGLMQMAGFASGSHTPSRLQPEPKQRDSVPYAEPSTTGNTITHLSQGSNTAAIPADSMEVDELGDDDNASTVTGSTALDAPTGSTGTAASSRKKAGPGSRGGVSSRVNSPSTDASKRGGKKKKVAGDATGSPAGGAVATKMQPQFHVLKKDDGEMCTRADIQFDFLDAIFNNQVKAFSVPDIIGHPRPLPLDQKITFGELYCYTLAGSPKATKSSREALLDLEPGTLPGKNKAGTAAALAAKRRKEAMVNGVDLVKAEAAAGVGIAGDEAGQEDMMDIDNYEGLKEGLSRVCLMINVGRINTTFAFYPLMRTMLRSYHSVPSLQKSNATRRALQDAPRLKIMLKGALLKDEKTQSTATEALQRAHEGHSPTTTVCNLLLHLILRPEPLQEKFFKRYPEGVNFLTLFTPLLISSTERAKAFLYIIYHYLESHATSNPFANEDRPNKMPILNVLSQLEYDALAENVDTAEELQFGTEMKAQRLQCVSELAHIKEEEEKLKADPEAMTAHMESLLTRDTLVVNKSRKTKATPASKKRKRPSGGDSVHTESTFDGDASQHEPHDRVEESERAMAGHDGGRRHSVINGYQSAPFDDEWAAGIETAGLDDITIHKLIHQVNEESRFWHFGPRETYPRHSPEIYQAGQYTPEPRRSVERQPPAAGSQASQQTPPAPPKNHSLSSLLN